MANVKVNLGSRNVRSELRPKGRVITQALLAIGSTLEDSLSWDELYGNERYSVVANAKEVLTPDAYSRYRKKLKRLHVKHLIYVLESMVGAQFFHFNEDNTAIMCCNPKLLVDSTGAFGGKEVTFQPMKIGRFFTRTLGIKAGDVLVDKYPNRNRDGIAVMDDVLRDVVEMLSVAVDISGATVEVLSGKQLADKYHSFNHNPTVNGAHLGSCMTWRGAVDLYEQNPKNVSLMFTDKGARGLLWTDDEGNKWYDTVYPCNGIGAQILRNFAENEHKAKPVDQFHGVISLNQADNGTVPYMDNLCWGYQDGSTLWISAEPERVSNEAGCSRYDVTELDCTQSDPFNYSSVYCECCGDSFREEDMQYVESAGGMICDSCREYDYVYCECCGELYRESDMMSTADGEIHCDNCFDHDTVKCECCDEVFSNSYCSMQSDEDGNPICEGCAEENTCEECGTITRSLNEDELCISCARRAGDNEDSED